MTTATGLDAAITNEVDPVAMAALAGYATTGELAIATANLDDRPPRHEGSTTTETLTFRLLLRVISGFNAASGTITGYTGSNPPNIVLPYEINGVPVVAIRG